MLRVTTSRKGLFAMAYDVRLDGRRIAGWSAKTWHPERRLTVDGIDVEFRAKGIAEFRLDGDPSAVAVRSGRAWDVTVGDAAYRMVGAGLGRRFTLERDGAEVGALWRTGSMRPSYTAELPEDLPATVQVFLLWAAMGVWRATTASAAAAATGAGA